MFNTAKKDNETLPDLKFNFNKKRSNDNSQNFTTSNNLENSDFLKDDRTIKNFYNFMNNQNNSGGINSQSPRVNLNLNSNNLNNFNNNSNSNIPNNNTTLSMNRSNTNNYLNTKIPKSIFGNINNNQHYCPYCTHCNNINDGQFDNMISHVREAKNIITNSFEYILHNNFVESNNSSIFSQNNTIKNDKDIMQEIEVLLNHNAKLFSHRKINNIKLVYKVVAHFLDSLLNEKVPFESLINNHKLLERFEKINISKAYAFEKEEESDLFDEEIEDLFDNKTKEKLKKLLRSKTLNQKLIIILYSNLIFFIIIFYQELI